MKTLVVGALCGAVLLLAACGDGRHEAHRQMDAVADSLRAARTIDLAVHFIPLLVELPEESGSPEVQWKDEVGRLEVRAGAGFALRIHEAPADMGRVKADLGRDLLRRNTIIVDEGDLLVYRSEFPDDTMLVYHHFIRSVEAAGRTFQVEDVRSERPFTLEEITRMSKAVRAADPT